MTDAHTPGPWAARRMHTGGFDIMDPRNRDVVTVYGGGVETESREANARLIAAAPDLLEALRQTTAQISVWRSINGDMVGALADLENNARAAIRKATGEA